MTDFYQGTDQQVGSLAPDDGVIDRGNFILDIDSPFTAGYAGAVTVDFDAIFKQVVNPDVIMWYYTQGGAPSYVRQLVKCPTNLVDYETGLTKFNISYNLEWSSSDKLALLTTGWVRSSPVSVQIFYVVTSRSVVKSNVLSPI